MEFCEKRAPVGALFSVEKGSEENVFYFLSDVRDNVFLNPSKDILDKYANRNKSIVIIKNLITDAPLQDIEQVNPDYSWFSL